MADRVALVTGAAQGLGRAEALELAERGARVVAVDKTPPAAAVDAIERSGGEAVAITADLGTYGGISDALERVFEAYGSVDVLVNNAGIVRDRMIYNLTEEDWEEVLAVNLSATFYLCRDVVRKWRSEDSAHRSGRVIVNTTSESGLYGNAGQANYAAAKAAVAAMTLTMAAELDRYGIRANAIAPRARTPMSVAAFGELPKFEGYDPFAPEHVASVVAWLVSDAARDVTGQVLVVHGEAIEVMRPWSTIRTLHRRAELTDSELLELRRQLFPDGDTRHVPPAVGDLFMIETDEPREVR